MNCWGSICIKLAIRSKKNGQDMLRHKTLSSRKKLLRVQHYGPMAPDSCGPAPTAGISQPLFGLGPQTSTHTIPDHKPREAACQTDYVRFKGLTTYNWQGKEALMILMRLLLKYCWVILNFMHAIYIYIHTQYNIYIFNYIQYIYNIYTEYMYNIQYIYIRTYIIIYI